MLGLIYLKKGNSAEALSQFKAAAAETDDETHAGAALCRAADIYFASGDRENAARELDGLLKRYPESPVAAYAQLRLGDIFLSSGKYPLAVLAYQSLMTNFPNTALKDKAMLRLAAAHLKNGSFAQAMNALEELIKAFPAYNSDAVYRFYLANTLYSLNRPGEALEIFRALTKNAANNGIAQESQYQAAWCEYRMGRDTEAADSFTAFAKKYPDSRLSKDALEQARSVLLAAAQNFEKWNMPEDAARLHKKAEELNK
jgi:TolA-binding protein